MVALTMKLSMKLALLELLLMSLSIIPSYGVLQVGFYNGKCNTTNVEKIVSKVVKKHFIRDRFITAALVRMQFHDCFVHGCDASILIDGNQTEKDALSNGSVKGFEVIDEAKATLEKICPGVVSCADIIVIAARVSVFLDGGKWYHVQTGRRDGLISQASDVDLPSPYLSISETIQAFAKKGLSIQDMVLLLGGHSVGMTHCTFIQDRLYNFQHSGKTDQTMNPTLAQFLKRRCPKDKIGQVLIPLNSKTNNVNLIDNSFYKQILVGRGILQIDQEIALDSRTSDFVKELAKNNNTFLAKFGEAMVKMGAIEVLTGEQGEIRRSCNSSLR
ncbi:peroxidase 60-like [Beta vulgaris subsp. vulgaris]|uniref:peroxidase 60-like n=1 Tax=Beta vulgaris subsp. vulgaris TaxID=3555 RepID=UPI002036CDEE|nr:peroxidase 60-like [Beta vulgaris subsp. vulgaris]